MDTLLPHELSEICPVMQPNEFDALRADIVAKGLLTPIVLYEGRILDGRHRYRASLELGLILTEDQMQLFQGSREEALEFVLRSGTWRHLTSAQAAIAAARASAAASHAGAKITQATLLSRFAVSERQLRKAIKIQADEPRLATIVAAKELSIDRATTLMEGDTETLNRFLEGDTASRRQMLKRPPAQQSTTLLRAAVAIKQCGNLKERVATLEEDELGELMACERSLRSLATILQMRVRKRSSATRQLGRNDSVSSY